MERALHPPVFHLDQHLSDWPECWLELRCPCSSRTVMHPVKMLLQRGDRPFRGMLAALRCSACQGKPAPVYLVAGHVRNHTGGPLPSWAMQLARAHTEAHDGGQLLPGHLAARGLAELQAMMPPGLAFDEALVIGSPPGCLGWWWG